MGRRGGGGGKKEWGGGMGGKMGVSICHNLITRSVVLQNALLKLESVSIIITPPSSFLVYNTTYPLV